MEVFADRREAGRILAAHLKFLRDEDVVVLGLPRGGVPVAAEVAKELRATLDVLCVRKIGVPRQLELAMGAVAEGGIVVREERVLTIAGVADSTFVACQHAEQHVLDDAVDRFRRGRPLTNLRGRTVVIVDDGLATGATARAACLSARQLGAATIILAVPVGPAEARGSFPEADRVIIAVTPPHFSAVGLHYGDFRPTSDDEVTVALDEAARRMHHNEVNASMEFDNEVVIPVDGVRLSGHLHLPPAARAVVLFAHGSGSSRTSPRNQFVAEVLNGAGLGTLLLDLLTPTEELDRGFVFDVELLATRLLAAAHWLRARPDTRHAALGYFGASTGAGAAFVAAAKEPGQVSAVVSRGGRPDLAGRYLGDVVAPSLLIVGGADDVVVELNRNALAKLNAPSRVAIVPGATHLFEEPGTLAQAATLARDFFVSELLAGAVREGVR